MDKVSLQFIADKAGVSKSLVSKVLNNKEVRVSESTRTKILEIADKYLYIPNRIAAGLRTCKTNMIGVIMPKLHTDFFASLVDAIEEEARSRGYDIILYNTQENPDLERRYLGLYKSGMMDGMLINPSDNEKNEPLYLSMIQDKYPFVFIDRYIHNINAGFVTSDGYYGANLLTNELIKRGHRKIYFLSHDKSRNTSVQIERYEGYKDAIIKRGLTPKRFYAEYEKPLEEQRMFEILASPDRPTALCLVSSMDIYYILKLCQKLNYFIPKDIEIATFDRFSLEYSDHANMELARYINKPPIIIDQNADEIGKRAVKIVCNQIENKDVEIAKIHLTPKLIGC